MRADLGIMISASHNPHHDNGIKFFGPDGFKLSDEAEAEIEALVEAGRGARASGDIGRAKRIDDGRSATWSGLKGTFPKGRSLEGLKVVIDCARRRAYKVAPEVLWELGRHRRPRRHLPQRLQHQRRLRLHRAQGGAEMGGRARRRPRASAGRRRRPRHPDRRTGHRRGRRPVMALMAAAGPTKAASRAGPLWPT
jgi:phosphoglucosamine mutase